jgi:ribosomal protein S3
MYGKLGVKCWICKGENKPQKAAAAQAPTETPLPVN